MTILDCCISLKGIIKIGCVGSCGYAPASVKENFGKERGHPGTIMDLLIKYSPLAVTHSALLERRNFTVCLKLERGLSLPLVDPSAHVTQ